MPIYRLSSQHSSSEHAVTSTQVELPCDDEAQQQTYSQVADGASAMLKRLRPWQILLLKTDVGAEGLALVRQVRMLSRTNHLTDVCSYDGYQEACCGMFRPPR